MLFCIKYIYPSVIHILRLCVNFFHIEPFSRKLIRYNVKVTMTEYKSK
jgi:hypothetical protein